MATDSSDPIFVATESEQPNPPASDNSTPAAPSETAPLDQLSPGDYVKARDEQERQAREDRAEEAGANKNTRNQRRQRLVGRLHEENAQLKERLSWYEKADQGRSERIEHENLTRSAEPTPGSKPAETTSQRSAQPESKTNSVDDTYFRSRLSSHYEGVREIMKSLPDAQKLISHAPKAMAGHVYVGVLEQDNSPEVAVHLIRNPQLIEDLNRMSPAKAMSRLGRISAQLEPAKERTAPPPPVRSVSGGSARTGVPLDELSPGEYVKVRNAQVLAKERGGRQ
jgi:hypothetical protein